MKKTRAPRLVTVAIFTTITIIFWIFFSLYNILTTQKDVQVNPRLLEPIDPSLNVELLNSLEEKTFYEEGEVGSPLIFEGLEPTPEGEILEEEAPPEEQLTEENISPTVFLEEQ